VILLLKGNAPRVLPVYNTEVALGKPKRRRTESIDWGIGVGPFRQIDKAPADRLNDCAIQEAGMEIKQ
jgi:hypothetical protein